MAPGLIDWEHPPSTRSRTVATGPRLLADGLVLIGSVVIVSIVVDALRGGQSVSARGLREFFVNGLPGSVKAAWAVLLTVCVAAAYALYDLLGLLGARRGPVCTLAHSTENANVASSDDEVQPSNGADEVAPRQEKKNEPPSV